MLFEEAFDKVDTTIEKTEKIAPTIGILNGLSGFNQSGKIIVMTDSACIDSVSSSVSKCYWLFDRFVKIATGDLKIDTSMMHNKYQLPNDYATNEKPRTQIFEELDFAELSETLYKQSHMNSQDKSCRIK